ncbi:hypothetical protein NDU88_002963 [Pleurodeles waltl]|uniref:Uncharacterized protein n=1 Tax=Pleurodeles waltl TaxID=8319 RepID=A0AAV7NF80_PLEWA|nr:hypothetical protein NDU88_002963 [Pleurodeles waltl]
MQKGTQQTHMDQYTVQGPGASLQKDPTSPSEKSAEPTGAQILAAIESSRHAMQTQISAIAVDVNLLRTDLRVVAELSVATEKQVTCLQSGMDTLKSSVDVLEAQTHKLEARVEDAEGRVIVRSDGTVNLERRRREREEAKLLVQTVTSEASSRSRSSCVAGRLSPDMSPEVT